MTDGDARRGIKFYSKNDKIEKFMTTDTLFISENAPASKALSLMNDTKITSLLVSQDPQVKKRNDIKLKGLVHIHSLLQYGIK